VAGKRCRSSTSTRISNCSPFDLAPLAKTLADRGLFQPHSRVDENGLWYAGFEVLANHDGPEGSIDALLNVIESLGSPLKKLWRGCSLREFDIGYECGDEPWVFNNGLSNQTLLRIGRVGGALRITLYPPERPMKSRIPITRK
jgi:hypothetical protein